MDDLQHYLIAPHRHICLCVCTWVCTHLDDSYEQGHQEPENPLSYKSLQDFCFELFYCYIFRAIFTVFIDLFNLISILVFKY